jgi:hypothetical protein
MIADRKILQPAVTTETNASCADPAHRQGGLEHVFMPERENRGIIFHVANEGLGFVLRHSSVTSIHGLMAKDIAKDLNVGRSEDSI